MEMGQRIEWKKRMSKGGNALELQCETQEYWFQTSRENHFLSGLCNNCMWMPQGMREVSQLISCLESLDTFLCSSPSLRWFSFLRKHGISVGRLVGALGLKFPITEWNEYRKQTNKQTNQITRLARPRGKVIQIQTFLGSWLQRVRHELQYSDGCQVSARCKGPETARSSF